MLFLVEIEKWDFRFEFELMDRGISRVLFLIGVLVFFCLIREEILRILPRILEDACPHRLDIEPALSQFCILAI